MGIGMGALDPDRKYVVVFEIYGPSSKAAGDAFDLDFKQLLSKYGGLVKHTWHAETVAVDPIMPKTVAGRAAKTAAAKKTPRKPPAS